MIEIHLLQQSFQIVLLRPSGTFLCIALLQIAHGMQEGGQEARVEVSLGHFEVCKGRLTFIAGPRKPARQVHSALKLLKMRLFLVTYLS